MLFAVSPGIGHLFPTIPLAWALRGAGHEVLVATAAHSRSSGIAHRGYRCARPRNFAPPSELNSARRVTVPTLGDCSQIRRRAVSTDASEGEVR